MGSFSACVAGLRFGAGAMSTGFWGDEQSLTLQAHKCPWDRTGADGGRWKELESQGEKVARWACQGLEAGRRHVRTLQGWDGKGSLATRAPSLGVPRSHKVQVTGWGLGLRGHCNHASGPHHGRYPGCPQTCSNCPSFPGFTCHWCIFFGEMSNQALCPCLNWVVVAEL